VDVSFAGENAKLPEILSALEIKRPNGSTLVLEVQKHLGEDSVRAIAMDATDGLTRGVEVVDTGSPITMPTGNVIKGRLVQRGRRSHRRHQPRPQNTVCPHPPQAPPLRGFVNFYRSPFHRY
jgi:F0F1-type ATP synthase beta subunit